MAGAAPDRGVPDQRCGGGAGRERGLKRRKRGLLPSQLVEGLFSLWAAGGERCEDLAQLREDTALALLLGHGLPAPQTARDFLEAFDEAVPPLCRVRAATSQAKASGCRAEAATAG